MSVQQHSCWLVGDGFPEDFGERLEQFMRVSGLGPRPLGRLLGVSSYRIREWRRGVVPSWGHLSRLLALAEDMGLREVLLCPVVRLPDQVQQTWSDDSTAREGTGASLHDHLKAGDS